MESFSDGPSGLPEEHNRRVCAGLVPLTRLCSVLTVGRCGFAGGDVRIKVLWVPRKSSSIDDISSEVLL